MGLLHGFAQSDEALEEVAADAAAAGVELSA
jgi:hypothetical protein